MIIPFTKAHGAKNDFLFTWASQAPLRDLNQIANAICDRHTGIGADGWYIVRPADEEADASVRLFNSDGSEAEMSGNGTRCTAAFLIAEGKHIGGPEIIIATGSGLKRLQLVSREDNRFVFEMNMGRPRIEPGHLRYKLPLSGGTVEVTILDVGNPQCAVFVEDLEIAWWRLGAELESHPQFPNRTNVSFVKAVDEHTIAVRFYERGAGETMSSGTGSTGAAAAAIARGLARSPVTVQTPAGSLILEWRGVEAYMEGPAEIVAKGEFYL
jgi:diaminopimelate epimerase